MTKLIFRAVILVLILLGISACGPTKRIQYKTYTTHAHFPMLIDGRIPPSGHPLPSDKIALVRMCNPSLLGSWTVERYGYHLFTGENLGGLPTIKLVSTINNRKLKEVGIYTYQVSSSGSDILINMEMVELKHYSISNQQKQYRGKTVFHLNSGDLTKLVMDTTPDN